MFEVVLGMLLPSRCPCCGAAGPAPCPSCWAKLERAPVIPSSAAVDRVRSLLRYDGAGRDLVVRMKYGNARSTVAWLASGMAGLAHAPPGGFDVVTWAPTSRPRRRERGFDQAEVLARAVARRLAPPPKPGLAHAPLGDLLDVAPPGAGRLDAAPLGVASAHVAPVDAGAGAGDRSFVAATTDRSGASGDQNPPIGQARPAGEPAAEPAGPAPTGRRPMTPSRRPARHPPVVPLLARLPGPAQTGRTRQERHARPPAFAPTRPVPPNVLLIDDVFTTGVTVSAAAQALRQGGATTVNVVTAACTPLKVHDGSADP